MEFIRRFAETDIGRSIGGRLDNEVDTLIHETAERFEEYGNQASQYFRKYYKFFHFFPVFRFLYS